MAFFRFNEYLWAGIIYDHQWRSIVIQPIHIARKVCSEHLGQSVANNALKPTAIGPTKITNSTEWSVVVL